MGLADLIGKELSGHQFVAVLYWRIKNPTVVTNARALAAVERIVGRALTGTEQTQLLGIVNDIINGNYTLEDLTHAQSLVETGDISNGEAKTLLGL